MEELARRHRQYACLKKVMLAHCASIMACECWQNDLYGIEKLQGTIEHMSLVADRLHESLSDLRRIEADVLRG
jgi:hypothetical protein